MVSMRKEPIRAVDPEEAQNVKAPGREEGRVRHGRKMRT